MNKRLIVAEKPSVGREIAKVLNCRGKAEGAIVGDQDVVTWARGHLVKQCLPNEIDDRYKEWKLEDLPIFPDPMPLRVIEDGEKQFNIISKWMNDPEIDSIVCATDAGREGELIFRFIYQVAGCTKPVKRLWISSLTFNAIKKGFEDLIDDTEYDDLYQSAKSRAEADWFVGINGCRAFSVSNNKRVRVGRVKTPTLAILVKRELERRNFKPEKYCELVISFDGWGGKMINPANGDDQNKWSRFPADREEELKQIAEAGHKEAVVASSESDEKIDPPLLLYDLTSLQRDANRIYNYSSKFTLDMAQNLYEKKAITYPRTDSRYLTADIKSNLDKRLESLCTGKWDKYARQALKSDKDLFGRFINDKGVSDHHAMIPTGEAKGMESWSNGEQKIYDLIVRRFIAMFLPDQILRHQKIVTRIGDVKFLSSGYKVLQAGWSSVDKTRQESYSELPDISEGDTVRITGMRVRTDQTKPPAPHTEASLLSAMEHAGNIDDDELAEAEETEFGIGTPATRAEIIEELIDDGMVDKNGRALRPTDYGIKLIEILPDFLCSPKMTGEWEARLRHISKGSEDPESFMDDIRKLTTSLVEYAAKQGESGLNDANVVGACPLCGQKVKEYKDGYYCINKECGFRRIWKARKGFYPTIQKDVMTKLLEAGRAETDKGVYTIIKTEPYIAFERAKESTPDYNALAKIISEFGLKPVNKVPHGGALWFEGKRGDEKMKDFVAVCAGIGCILQYSVNSKALKHNSGWYLRVKPEYKDAFDKVFG